MRSTLAQALYAQNITQAQLAKKLGVSISYVSRRMSGRADWTIGEAYMILAILELDYLEFTNYFPPKMKEGQKICVKTRLSVV